MIVVADTTPINYLILIGEIDILTQLYGRVVIPLKSQSSVYSNSGAAADEVSTSELFRRVGHAAHEKNRA
jgi:predicted nucleic acid-binding protein